MPKFHISQDGMPRICKAKSAEACPASGPDGAKAPHGEFETTEEAMHFAESVNKQAFATIPNGIKNSSEQKNFGSSADAIEYFYAVGFTDGDEDSGMFREDGAGIRFEENGVSIWRPEWPADSETHDWEPVATAEAAYEELTGDPVSYSMSEAGARYYSEVVYSGDHLSVDTQDVDEMGRLTDDEIKDEFPNLRFIEAGGTTSDGYPRWKVYGSKREIEAFLGGEVNFGENFTESGTTAVLETVKP